MSLGLQGWAPLRHAVFMGDVAMVQLFLSHGASVDDRRIRQASMLVFA